MTIATSSATATDGQVLRVNDPAPVLFQLNTLIVLLESLQTIHESCDWLAATSEREAERFGLLLPGWRPSPLVVRGIGSGSLWVDLAQEIAPGLGVGGALWMTARVLRQGPGKLYEWAGLLPRAQAEWITQRANTSEARARLRAAQAAETAASAMVVKAHEALLDVAEIAPQLEVRVVDESGTEIPEPPLDIEERLYRPLGDG